MLEKIFSLSGRSGHRRQEDVGVWSTRGQHRKNSCRVGDRVWVEFILIKWSRRYLILLKVFEGTPEQEWKVLSSNSPESTTARSHVGHTLVVAVISIFNWVASYVQRERGRGLSLISGCSTWQSWKRGLLFFPGEHKPEKPGSATFIFQYKVKAYLRAEPTETRQSQEAEGSWNRVTFFYHWF